MIGTRHRDPFEGKVVFVGPFVRFDLYPESPASLSYQHP